MKTLTYAFKNEWYNLILLALPFIAIPFIFSHLPNKVPMQWSLDGQASSYSTDKWLALMLLPAINILVYFALTTEALSKDKRPKTLRTSIVLSLLYIYGTNIIVNFGVNIAPINLLLPLTAVILFFTGNYFRTHEPGGFIGIHLPWSFDDPQKWHRSHRMAVFLWMVAGLWLMSILFWGSIRTKINLFYTTIAVVAFLPTVYSFYQYNIKY